MDTFVWRPTLQNPLSLTRQSTCLTASIGSFLSSFPAPLLSPADGRTTSSTPLLTPQVEQFPVVTFVQRPSGLPTHAAEVFGLGLGLTDLCKVGNFGFQTLGKGLRLSLPPTPPPRPERLEGFEFPICHIVSSGLWGSNGRLQLFDFACAFWLCRLLGHQTVEHRYISSWVDRV